MTNTRCFRIGTRGSPLAMAQTMAAVQALRERLPELQEPDRLSVVQIKTTGDTVRDRPLAEVGGKGLFSKEIDEAMLRGRIDIAVHSLKDLPTWLPHGIALASVPPRADARDVLITGLGHTLASLPPGTIVGTASLRRQAQILHRRPDLTVVNLRGNVHTRLRKLRERAVGATLLALAGLQRLGIADAATVILKPEEFLPAVGQGAIGITCREDDAVAMSLVSALEDPEARSAVTAERAMLEALDGSCRTPIGGFARYSADDEGFRLDGLVAHPNGTGLVSTFRIGARTDAYLIGRDAGEELRSRADPAIFQW